MHKFNRMNPVVLAQNWIHSIEFVYGATSDVGDRRLPSAYMARPAIMGDRRLPSAYMARPVIMGDRRLPSAYMARLAIMGDRRLPRLLKTQKILPCWLKSSLVEYV